MRVKEVMSECPITILPGTPILEAHRLMQARHVRHLLVLEHGRLVGIVTDRDIRLSMPATTLWSWELEYVSTQLTAGQVMTTRLIVVDPMREATEAAALLVSQKIGALPVVNEGLLVGIVTASDFVRAFIKLAQATV